MNMCLFPLRPKIVCFAILLCITEQFLHRASSGLGRRRRTTVHHNNGQSLNCSDNQGLVEAVGFPFQREIVTRDQESRFESSSVSRET